MLSIHLHYLLLLLLIATLSKAHTTASGLDQGSIAVARSHHEMMHSTAPIRSKRSIPFQHTRKMRKIRRQRKRLLPLFTARLNSNKASTEDGATDPPKAAAAAVATAPTTTKADDTIPILEEMLKPTTPKAAKVTKEEVVEKPTTKKTKIKADKKVKVDRSVPVGDLWNLLQIWKAIKRMFPGASKMLTSAKEELKVMANKKEIYDST